MSAYKPAGPEGIGGWLILPLIGLILTPLKVGAFLLQTYPPIFSDGTWEALTGPGSESYHSLWAPLLVGEIVGNLLVIAISLVALVCFLLKSWRTPMLMIGLMVFNLVFVVGDYLLAGLIPLVAAQDDPESIREVARSAIAALIWIPYFLLSKRVHNTFVRPFVAPTGAVPPPTLPHG